MPMSDYKYVNFSQEHELNRHLKKVDKRQTQANREVLAVMGSELKNNVDKEHLTHDKFHAYICTQLTRLE